jgi:hypothetical protein
MDKKLLFEIGDKERKEIEFFHDRLRQKGMRWNQESGQFILTLIAKQLSGLWEEKVVNPIRKLYD